MPVSCVDIVPIYQDKFLLAKRLNIPDKGEWYMPGGRVLLGETFMEAAKRKIFEEIGIAIEDKNLSYLATDETIFNNNDYIRHTINIVFKCSLKKNPIIKIDSKQFSDFGWFEKIDNHWPNYVKKMLQISGFREN